MRQRTYFALAFFAAIAASFWVPSFAQTAQAVIVPADTHVTIAEPGTVQLALDHIVDFVALAIVAIIAKFAGPLAGFINALGIDKTIRNTIKGYLSKALIAAHIDPSKPITVDVHNNIIAGVANEVVDVIPGWLLRWCGGVEGIKRQVRNRLPDYLKGLLPETPVAEVKVKPR